MRILKSIILSVILLACLSISAWAGPECKSYAYNQDKNWQLSFSCGTSGLGAVDFVNNGEVLKTYMYFYFYDSTSGYNTVVICLSSVVNGENVPYHIFLYLTDKILVYPYFGMIFEETP